MKTLPAQLYDIKSNAEKRTFNLLQKSNSLGKDAVAFHSLNIPHHIKQRFGEADFVIISKFGLLVLEIKGGRVKRDEYGWHFINRYNSDTVKRRGPFEQAQEAMHSIFNSLEKKFDYNLTKKITIGYGVITPDCNLPSSSEWDDNTILTANNFMFLDKWLQKLVKFWKNKENRKISSYLTNSEIKIICKYLRPHFDCALALTAQLDSIENLIYRLTEDQFKFLDVIEINKRVLCSGGAGTGKTFMAAELCRRFLSTEKILFVCKSKILGHYLHNLLKLNNTIISTIESIKLKTKRNNIEQYDILIIDEGQDLCNFTDIELIGNYLKGGWEDGRWVFFSDINNQANIVGEFEDDAMEYLKSCDPVEIPLKKNCRNTEPIMKKIQDLTNFDMGNRGTGIGPDVRYIYCKEEPEHCLVAELNRLSKENIPRENIIILSPQNFKNSCVNKLTNSSKAKIKIIDERNVSNPVINKIKFSQISDFKGLESQCVILVDIDKSINHYNSLLYIGMSRAKALLAIILKE